MAAQVAADALLVDHGEDAAAFPLVDADRLGLDAIEKFMFRSFQLTTLRTARPLSSSRVRYPFSSIQLDRPPIMSSTILKP